MNEKIIFFFTCAFIHYKKKIKIFVSYINYLFEELLIFNFFSNYFFKTKKTIFKSKEFNDFIDKNSKFWQKKNKLNTNFDKNILVENFINQPAYTMSNAVIATYIKNIFNYNIVGLLRKGDYAGKAIFESYGIKDIYYYKNINIFQRLRVLFISLKLIKNYKKINDFCKIKYKNISVGLSSYDSYVRYTGKPSLKFINSELVYFLSDSIAASIFFDNFLDKRKIKFSVQAETAFSPSNNLFQTCLKKKIKVFTRLGTNTFSIRIYKEWRERYTYRATFEKKIFEKIYSKRKKYCTKKYDLFHKKEIKDRKFGLDVAVQDNIIKTKAVTKTDIKKLFNWDNKKVAVIFLHHFIDGNFHCGPRKTFMDNYTWAKFTINALSKIKSVNWIIKPHPSQYVYKTRDNLQKEIEILIKNNKHIKIFPREFSQSSLLNITDFAITSHGTAGVEYLAHGINTVYCDNSFYSNLKFIKMSEGSSNYLKTLKNLNKLKIPTNDMINKAKTFLYIRHHLVKCDCSLLSQHSTTRKIDKKLFWTQNTVRLKKFSFDKDELYNMFKLQLKHNWEHSISFNKLNIKDKNFFQNKIKYGYKC
mgnify:CR=1 FL=1